MQLLDRVAHTSVFLPAGRVVNGAPAYISGGGSPLLCQHLFWFLGHPEVYVLILPAFGIVAEILANNSRKPLWGYKSLVFSVLVIGFLSFVVWARSEERRVGKECSVGGRVWCSKHRMK